MTIDTMACQPKIAKAVTDKGGDYLLAAAKGNQGKLSTVVQKAFAPNRRAPIDKSVCWVEIVMVENYRAPKGKEPELEYRYYISSANLIPAEAGSAIRAHWGIESMHWILDVSMREDACQIYRENAAENLAGLRHMSLNMLRAEPTKISIPMKQKRCMMDPAFLEKVLAAGIESMAKS